jgi:acetyltransferase-like isoleucine patch superfamily enzyme
MSQVKFYEAQIRDVQFGETVKIVRPCNIYECSIESHSFVGPFCEIQKMVQIGERCKIQSHTFTCELVTIGNDCFIGYGVMFINDLFADGGLAGGDKSKWKSISIGNNVSIGSNATILPVEIRDNLVIGAGELVTKNLTQTSVYTGNPEWVLKMIIK